MKRINIWIILFLLIGTTSCNEDEVFEREQYKKVFALISSDGYNIFNVVHDMEETESVGYVAVSCGGTTSIEKDININMVWSKEPFDRYNKGNYDVDVEKYAQLVPEDKYDIDDYRITVPAGERSGRMGIRVRPEGLSPDSVYFIPLKIDKYSDYEVNPNKSDILYRVFIKNRYATQETLTNYNLRGVLNGTNTLGIKPMHPISRNRVRIMAGNEMFESNVEVLNRAAIILEIDEDNNVHISPYKDINVTQVNGDPDFPNTFRIEDDGYSTYKTFLLCYNFVIGSTNYTMREELRLEFDEDDE
jgi:hypothetical protein